MVQSPQSHEKWHHSRGALSFVSPILRPSHPHKTRNIFGTSTSDMPPSTIVSPTRAPNQETVQAMWNGRNRVGWRTCSPIPDKGEDSLWRMQLTAAIRSRDGRPWWCSSASFPTRSSGVLIRVPPPPSHQFFCFFLSRTLAPCVQHSAMHPSPVRPITRCKGLSRWETKRGETNWQPRKHKYPRHTQAT